ncbi:uncharacterized protein CMU_005830 [Cryptosporidium muris RN66]|uniref:Apoptosis-antagonizing transcription factor C-terminal domain-containing protein n=1 Tax=Cryptosporidium muris (strain RN66) TaxID=441375 RepID=B6AHG5_CRYMR|nr:uncharacterized protein CMU_005830 [Cryptosporidium muris RN66]EEA07660.1 hypothetical protein CMU_005830 [Cryptosporidium muris RN66]|eukprot:XP_002142009.1 hypothetical protein [Cryptosporidium muris RN66]
MDKPKYSLVLSDEEFCGDSDDLNSETDLINSSCDNLATDDTLYVNESGRLLFRAKIALPQKYHGDKTSSSEFYKAKDLKEIDEIYNHYDNHLINTEDNTSKIDGSQNFKLSDEICRKFEALSKEASEFSLVDKDSVKEKLQSTIEKGKHVKNQQFIWTQLLGLRIFMQNILNATNQLPPFPILSYINGDRDLLTETYRDLVNLLVDIHKLQESMCNSNSTILDFLLCGTLNENELWLDDDLLSNKSGEEPELNINKNKRERYDDGFWRKYDVLPRKTLKWCLDIADEWKKSTQIEVQRNFRALDQPISVQLRHNLTDKNRLIQKCHPNLSTANFIGSDIIRNGNFSNILETLVQDIFDDTDFFVTLLKDVVSNKTDMNMKNSLNISSIYNRGTRKVNDVDRRASKGRKIRYVPIKKLENFMTAIPINPNISYLPGANDEEFVNCLMSGLLVS